MIRKLKTFVTSLGFFDQAIAAPTMKAALTAWGADSNLFHQGERIVVGGGFRDSRLGELAIARTEIILKAEGFKIEMLPIRYHPDDAGLIGALHLAPSWIFKGHDSILAVDIGGTNIRCAVVETTRKKTPDLSKASVWRSSGSPRSYLNRTSAVPSSNPNTRLSWPIAAFSLAPLRSAGALPSHQHRPSAKNACPPPSQPQP